MPAAAMQRTTQRSKAFPAMIRPNSNSDSSPLFSDTRCEDETNKRGATAGTEPPRRCTALDERLFIRVFGHPDCRLQTTEACYFMVATFATRDDTKRV